MSQLSSCWVSFPHHLTELQKTKVLTQKNHRIFFKKSKKAVEVCFTYPLCLSPWGKSFSFSLQHQDQPIFYSLKESTVSCETLGNVQLLERLAAEGLCFLQDGEEMQPASVVPQFCVDIFPLRCSLSAVGQPSPQAADDISSHRHFSS